MRTSELHYELPQELIAREPADRRDESRLLVLDRASGTCGHHLFRELPELLPEGALLVLNDTKVLPARLRMHRKSGGRVEGLFLEEKTPHQWEVMLTGAGKVKPGEELQMDRSAHRLRMVERIDPTTWVAEPVPGGDTLDILQAAGVAPLPPYIERARKEAREKQPRTTSSAPQTDQPETEQEAHDLQRYQTVFARQPGAVAAPTAGLHFTPELLEQMRDKGFDIVYLTLHVGIGTFLPIRCENLTEHDMHEERYHCSPKTAAAVNEAKDQRRPVVAVGTTTVRVLESLADENGRIESGHGTTRLFIYPPYTYKIVDKLITNFHLPGSTLLAMIYAFAGKETIRNAYQQAIEKRYRFYSYGDAMLIL